MAESLRFAPSILARLGEELVPHPDQGIIELAKNAYDADARACRVVLSDVAQPGGTIEVTDDGDGMTVEQIRAGWLVLGRSGKDPSRRTRLGRLPAGQKGLGRLAALRLGKSVALSTRPVAEPETEYRMEIDWTLFERADVVEDVDLVIESGSTSEPPGTSITIREIVTAFGRVDTKRLARSLILLTDPFDSESGFRAELIADDHRDLEELVRNGYFAESRYLLRATLGPDGLASAEVLDHTGGLRWKGEHEDLRRSGPYRAPPAGFDLWEFALEKAAFAEKTATVGEVRDWLGEVGGVHLYYRGLRVRPYGDRGHDWLEMNLRRARSPEGRPSTNNSIGLVTVDDPGNLFTEKTDRSGFIESHAFSELRDFAGDALDWMARLRVKERDRERRKNRKRIGARRAEGRRMVEEAVARVPPEQREGLEAAIERLNREQDQEREALLTDLHLYRTLSSVGTTASVFAHDAAGPLNRIDRVTNAIERRAAAMLGDDLYPKTLGKQVRLLRRAAQALRSFVRLPLTLLRREKRSVHIMDVHQTIDDVLELFEPFLNDAEVTIKTEYVDSSPRIRGRPASLESIVVNLMTNAIGAFRRSKILGSRELFVRTVVLDEQLLLSVRDNGPGIRGIRPDDIWSPGQTTTPGGTGIGLTIVRDETVWRS